MYTRSKDYSYTHLLIANTVQEKDAHSLQGIHNDKEVVKHDAEGHQKTEDPPKS